jgi:ATP-dependent DNA helicase RecQ
MQKLITVVIKVKEKFKAEHVVNILVGNDDAAVKSYKHNELEVFGLGKDTEKTVWDAVIRQGLIAAYIDKEIENYGLLKITALGREFLEKPIEFMMTENHQYEDDDSGPLGLGTSALDSTLFNILKDTRKKVGHRLGLPPFVIFQDPSLEAMATNYPISIEELQSMPGVGQGKAKRYGKEFIELITRYVKENDIERPADLIIRSVADRSKLKIYLIQSIDRKMPLDLIAAAKGIDMSALLAELETIVFSGTKINIDYYINEVLDEDTIDDIFLYFKEDAESDSLKAALEELGEEDYEEEAIRLMRLKFISEMGN